jgi:hypothetical protein
MPVQLAQYARLEASRAMATLAAAGKFIESAMRTSPPAAMHQRET